MELSNLESPGKRARCVGHADLESSLPGRPTHYLADQRCPRPTPPSLPLFVRFRALFLSGEFAELNGVLVQWETRAIYIHSMFNILPWYVCHCVAP